MKRVLGVFVIVGVILVALILFDGDLTGNVIWESPSDSFCNVSSMNALWDSVFVESSSGIVVLNDSSADCDNFILYKLGSAATGTWVLAYDGNVEGYWMNVSDVLRDSIGSHGVWTSGLDGVFDGYVGNFENIINRSYDSAAAVGSIEGHFDFGESISWLNAEDRSTYTGDDVGIWTYFNESYEKVLYIVVPTGSLSVSVVKTGDVPNFTFVRNSSWNVAFDVGDYFDYALEFFEFSYVGVNNTNGVWINYSFVGPQVRFMPTFNFTGNRDFRINVSNGTGFVESNTFNVLIVEYINGAPNLTKDFGALTLSRGASLLVDLEDYFDDPDGDDLVYRAVDNDSLGVSFNGSEMRVSLGVNFSSGDWFRVYAGDGELETRSGKIYVYELGVSVVDGPFINQSDNSSLAIVGIGGDNGSAGGNSSIGDGAGGEISLKWVLIFLGGLVVLVGIGAVVYFVFLRDRGVVAAVDEKQSAEQVNSYLRSLEMGK